MTTATKAGAVSSAARLLDLVGPALGGVMCRLHTDLCPTMRPPCFAWVPKLSTVTLVVTWALVAHATTPFMSTSTMRLPMKA